MRKKPVCGHTLLKADYRQPQHVGEILNQVAYAPLLKKEIESSAKPETPVKAFLAFRLYLLTLDALDYTKFRGAPAARIKPAELSKSTEIDSYKLPFDLGYQLITAAPFLQPVNGLKIEKIHTTLPDVCRNAEKNVM